MKISRNEYYRWRQQYYTFNCDERMGQAFINQMTNGITDPQLFYEQNNDVADRLIQDNYVDDRQLLVE